MATRWRHLGSNQIVAVVAEYLVTQAALISPASGFCDCSLLKFFVTVQTCYPLSVSISARAEKHKQVSELEITRGETLGSRQTSSTVSHAAIQQCLWGGRDDV